MAADTVAPESPPRRSPNSVGPLPKKLDHDARRQDARRQLARVVSTPAPPPQISHLQLARPQLARSMSPAADQVACRQDARAKSSVSDAGSSSVLGARPSLTVTFARRSYRAMSAATSPPSPLTGRRLLISACLTMSGVHSGWAESRPAAMRATTGLAIEVPPIRKYRPSTRHAAHSLANSLSGASGATMCAPGASTSGLSKPSCVTPRLDHDATASSLVNFVPRSSTAPTEITNGSLPGAYKTASGSSPRLPAAVTTTRPANQAASAAASRGSSRYDCAWLEFSDRFTTRMP